MKKILSALMITAVLMTGNVFADTPEVMPISAPIEKEVSKEEPIPTLYEEVKAEDKVKMVKFEANAQEIDGVMMVPLRSTLEKAGYTLKWHEDTHSVDISKGNQWTNIKIGKNLYFFNRVAPFQLSKEPVIIDGRTLVPAEFFNAILNLGLEIIDGKLIISDEMVAVHRGYVQEIKNDENGNMSITISSQEVPKDEFDKKIIHLSSDNTYVNTKVEKGLFVNVITPPIMTMSIPAQTSGVIVY
ncbi:copper amine oxidase N-terminal domain-containing protein [Anaeromicrobium sediminis]|uniref:Copper amine oxidase-like N-terminal domain-containing protein n=1 Tax=Anaeromicrobium sediminis TaxID=1478221 RepID=A0A267MFN8_9FIRM|nr:copper amine oxidase N-terminal domain-containing protein [Anaeromicrobium sediminis]PAB58389.1 hypothetical protein CCE28_15740 [Anaeromicrobium sediminis]